MIRFEQHRILDAIIECPNLHAMSFHADGINARVGAACSCGFTQCLEDIDILVVQDLRTEVGGELQPVRNTIDCNHPFSIEHEGTLNGEKTDWTGSTDVDGISRPYLTVLGCHVTR